MPFGEDQYYWKINQAAYDWNNYTSAASTTMQVYPAMVAVPTPEPEPEPEPQTVLDWLRGQVSEVCEMAFAA